MKYCLKNFHLIDGKEELEIRENLMILVKDNKIEKISENIEIPSDYKVIDLEGKYLMPGMINLHAHLFGSGKPSKSLGGGKSQELLMKFIKTKLGKKVLKTLVSNNVKNALHSGLTTIRGVGDFHYSDVLVRDLINQGKLEGPKLIVSGPAITSPTGHGAKTFSMTANTLQGYENLVTKNKEHNVDLIKICVTGGVMDAKVKGEPGELKMTLEETKAVCDKAHEYGYLVASHTESSKGMEVAIRGGVDTIEHGSQMTPELIKLMKEHNSCLVVTLSPAIPLAILDPSITRLDDLAKYNTEILLENMIEGAKEAVENNITVGLGTDASCPLATQYNFYRELKYFVSKLNVSNAFAIYTATNVNSKILRMDNEIGTIEEGKIADMLVINDNPYDDLDNLKQPAMVINKGKIIKNPKIKRNKKVDSYLDSIAL